MSEEELKNVIEDFQERFQEKMFTLISKFNEIKDAFNRVQDGLDFLGKIRMQTIENKQLYSKMENSFKNLERRLREMSIGGFQIPAAEEEKDSKKEKASTDDIAELLGAKLKGKSKEEIKDSLEEFGSAEDLPSLDDILTEEEEEEEEEKEKDIIEEQIEEEREMPKEKEEEEEKEKDIIEEQIEEEREMPKEKEEEEKEQEIPPPPPEPELETMNQSEHALSAEVEEPSVSEPADQPEPSPKLTPETEAKPEPSPQPTQSAEVEESTISEPPKQTEPSQSPSPSVSEQESVTTAPSISDIAEEQTSSQEQNAPAVDEDEDLTPVPEFKSQVNEEKITPEPQPASEIKKETTPDLTSDIAPPPKNTSSPTTVGQAETTHPAEETENQQLASQRIDNPRGISDIWHNLKIDIQLSETNEQIALSLNSASKSLKNFVKFHKVLFELLNKASEFRRKGPDEPVDDGDKMGLLSKIDNWKLEIRS